MIFSQIFSIHNWLNLEILQIQRSDYNDMFFLKGVWSKTRGERISLVIITLFQVKGIGELEYRGDSKVKRIGQI
jgi:hypothetical protein